MSYRQSFLAKTECGSKVDAFEDKTSDRGGVLDCETLRLMSCHC
jgi:hypothetical protein